MACFLGKNWQIWYRIISDLSLLQNPNWFQTERGVSLQTLIPRTYTSPLRGDVLSTKIAIKGPPLQNPAFGRILVLRTPPPLEQIWDI